MTPIVQATAAAAIALGAGAATVSVMRDEVPAAVIPAGNWAPGTALDGRVFHTVDTVVETGEVLTDELHFRDGLFQSAKCQDYCDFGWSGYRTWTEGEKIHFTARTECPDAPHSMVWYGTVSGETMAVQATWTTHRWYWTRQIRTSGEGRVVTAGTEASNG